MVSEVSILIPIYNYDITTLVQQLQGQCLQAAIQFEIICLDDASDDWCKTANQKLKFLKNVVYEELPANISRAAIRNVLTKKAQYAYLLFLDNDSEIPSDQFILTYLKLANPNSIYIGGTIYQQHQPTPEYRLHWYYGIKREQRPAAIRQQRPYHQLQVNNLFVSRAIYLANPLPHIIKTYGHEDTLWGIHLSKAKIAVSHIDNPVYHAGLVSTPDFLIKTKQAIDNLVLLFHTEKKLNSSLIQAYQFLKKILAISLFRWFFLKIQPLLLLQLQSDRPSLFLFDIYKLGLFVNAMLRNNDPTLKL